MEYLIELNLLKLMLTSGEDDHDAQLDLRVKNYSYFRN